MIVGRDTNVLDETGVVKAAVETVAENTSDGVIAPMLYTALGGPVLGFDQPDITEYDTTNQVWQEKYGTEKIGTPDAFGKCHRNEK